jgi:biotin synthase
MDAVLATADEPAPSPLQIRMWDPSTQLRFAKKTTVPTRPDGAANRWPEQRPAA